MYFKLLLAFLILLVTASCAADTTYHVVEFQTCKITAPLTRPVYIDDTFTDEEIFQIQSGLTEWQYATNQGIVYMVAGKLKHTTFSQFPTNSDRVSVFVHRVTEDHPYAANIGEKVIGRASRNVVVLRINKLTPIIKVKTVLMHEIGHTMGLPHNNIDSALMYPTCAKICLNPTITMGDISTLCGVATNYSDEVTECSYETDN